MLLAFPREDVPDEISNTEGDQAEVLGPSALVVVPATSVQAWRGGPRGFVAGLACRLHPCLAVARTTHHQPRGALCREAVAAWLADASGTQTGT